MPETDLPTPNPKDAQSGRVSGRRRFAGVMALLLLVIIAWLGWQQVQLMLRQAAAPVFSMTEEGHVSINGRRLVIGTDGLPPKVLEIIEGGPPVELSPNRDMTGLMLKQSVNTPRWGRAWHYPRTGLVINIYREMNAGIVSYLGEMEIGQCSRGQYLAATLEFRGRRWWLGPPGPLGPLMQRHIRPAVREGDEAKDEDWQCVLRPREGQLRVEYEIYLPLPGLPAGWFEGRRVRAMILGLPRAAGLTVVEKFAASGATTYEEGDANRVW